MTAAEAREKAIANLPNQMERHYSMVLSDISHAVDNGFLDIKTGWYFSEDGNNEYRKRLENDGYVLTLLENRWSKTIVNKEMVDLPIMHISWVQKPSQ